MTERVERVLPNAREIESTTGSFPFEKRFAPTDCAYNITIIHCRDYINRIGNIDSVDSIVEVYSKNNIDRVDSPLCSSDCTQKDRKHSQ